MYRIIAYLKENNKTVGYRVTDGNSYRDYTIFELLTLMNGGMKITNAYVRGGSVVLKSKNNVDILYKPCEQRVVKANQRVKPILITCDSSVAIHSIDATFDLYFNSKHLDTKALEIIKEIDNAVPADNKVKEFGRFKTKFGICDLWGLSSGCKTALLVYQAQKEKRKVVYSLNSAGANAIEVICKFLIGCNNQYPILYFMYLPNANHDDSLLYKYVFTDIKCDVTDNLLNLVLKHEWEDE